MVAARVVVTKDAVDALPPEPEHAGVIQVTASSAAKIQEHPRLSMYVIIGWTGDGCKFGLTAIGRKRLSWAEGVRNGQIRSCFAKFRVPVVPLCETSWLEVQLQGTEKRATEAGTKNSYIGPCTSLPDIIHPNQLCLTIN